MARTKARERAVRSSSSTTVGVWRTSVLMA
jgi:hypothetical protein